MNNKISTLRKEIDQIDDRIFRLFEKRFRITNKIMKEKKKLNIPRTDKKRENEIIDEKVKKFEFFNKGFIKNIYKQIFEESKKQTLL